MVFFIPLQNREHVALLSAETMFAGFNVMGYTIEEQLAWENGQLVVRGRSLNSARIAVLPSILPYTVAFGIWNWFVDSVADTGIGDFLRIEPGHQKNPFRIEFVQGYTSGPPVRPAQGGQQLAGPVGGGGQHQPQHHLPGIGTYVPIYRDEMRAWQAAQYKKGRRIETPKGAYKPTKDTFGRGIIVATSHAETEEILSFKQGKDYWREGEKSPVGFLYIDSKVARGEKISEKELEAMKKGKWNPFLDGTLKNPKLYMLENERQLGDFYRDCAAVPKIEDGFSKDMHYGIRDFERDFGRQRIREMRKYNLETDGCYSPLNKHSLS